MLTLVSATSPLTVIGPDTDERFLYSNIRWLPNRGDLEHFSATIWYAITSPFAALKPEYVIKSPGSNGAHDQKGLGLGYFVSLLVAQVCIPRIFGQEYEQDPLRRICTLYQRPVAAGAERVVDRPLYTHGKSRKGYYAWGSGHRL